MPKKEKNVLSKKSLVLALLVLGFIAFIITRLIYSHLFSVIMSEDVYRSDKDESSTAFTLFSGYEIMEYKDDYERFKGRTVVSLAPGQDFEGELIIKNHARFPRTFKVKVGGVGFYEGDEFVGREKSQGVLPTLSFIDHNEFFVDAEGVKVLQYKITAPENIDEKIYRFDLQLIATDSKAEKFTQGPMVLDLAVGDRIILFVSDEPHDIQYNIVTDNVNDFAVSRLLYYWRLGIAIVLVFVTLFYLFKAYKK